MPLDASARRIAVVGPLADARAEMLGCWSAAGDPRDAVTIVDGLRAAMPHAEILHAAGVGIDRRRPERHRGARSISADRADVVLLCVGEAAADER